MKKIIALLLALTFVFSLAACNGDGNEQETTTAATFEYETAKPVYVSKYGVLYGPFGLPSTAIATDRSYAFDVEFFSSIGDVYDKLKDGSLEIGTLPIREAVKLYNETNGAVKILAASNSSFVHILQKGDSVKTLADLNGKKIYALGENTSNDKIMKHLLAKAGVSAEIEYVDTYDNLVAKEDAEIVIMPEPNASKLVYTSKMEFKPAIHIQNAWKELFGFDILQACIVARTDYIEAHPDAVADFLTYYEVSVNFMNDTDLRKGSIPALLLNNKFFSNAEHSLMSVKMSGLIFMTGDDLKAAVAANAKEMTLYDPEMADAKIPSDDICY